MAGGRPKNPPKGQASIYDRKIEDEALEQMMDACYENMDAYKSYLENRKAIRQRLEQAHPNLIRGFLEDPDEEEDPEAVADSGYVLCGRYRFQASAPYRAPVPAGTKEVKAKPATKGWRFDVAQLLTGPAVEEPAPVRKTRKMSVDGQDADVSVSERAASLIDESRRTPATADEAERQAQAEANLRSRSSNGNG